MLMRARKSDEVLLAARHVFLDRGFEMATVEEIAAEAGVSKATIYSNFHDKDALLAAMIDQVTAESARILAAALGQLEASGTTEDRLRRLGESLARGVLNPDVVLLRRLAISSAVAFPASAALYWQRGPAAALVLLEDLLAALVEAGELVIADIGATAAQFAYALIGPIQDRLLFDAGYLPADGEVERYVTNAVRQLMLASAVA
jgi:TetR/AcrR family transcriptional repressor of mexJK operon